PVFDATRTLIVSDPVPEPPGAGAASTNADAVEFVSYAPKHIELRAAAPRPSVLLLNDKFDPGWKVTVDGKSANLLRCNFIMRGVYLPAGQHAIIFKFQPDAKMFYVTL